MARAIWRGEVIAESDDVVLVEGNHYFPVSSLTVGVVQPSSTTSICPWKGTASYYDIVVGEAVNRDAAWFYAEPKVAAKQVEGRVAFWNGVLIEEPVSG